MLANLFGNLTSGIIRLAVTAATIVLVYLFILKPILETTENVSGSISSNTDVQKAIDSVNEAFGEQGSQSIKRQIEMQLKGVKNTSATNTPEMRKAQRMLKCVQKANGDVNKMQRCAERFGP